MPIDDLFTFALQLRGARQDFECGLVPRRFKFSAKFMIGFPASRHPLGGFMLELRALEKSISAQPRLTMRAARTKEAPRPYGGCSSVG